MRETLLSTTQVSRSGVDDTWGSIRLPLCANENYA